MTDNQGISPAERELLTMLIEEAAEVQQAATKALRHGWLGTDYSTGSRVIYNNKWDLERELGDFVAIMCQLIRQDGAPILDEDRILNQANNAWKKKLKFTHHQEKEK